MSIVQGFLIGERCFQEIIDCLRGHFVRGHQDAACTHRVLVRFSALIGAAGDRAWRKLMFSQHLFHLRRHVHERQVPRKVRFDAGTVRNTRVMSIHVDLPR